MSASGWPSIDPYWVGIETEALSAAAALGHACGDRAFQWFPLILEFFLGCLLKDHRGESS